MIISGCNKDKEKDKEKSLPTVITLEVTNIDASFATGGGEITDDGNASITERGVCWNTLPDPTFSGQHAACATSGTGQYTVQMTGLSPNTNYHVRAYATNSEGTAYGEDKTFKSTL